MATIPLGVQTRFRARVVAIRDGELWSASSGSVDVRVNGDLLGFGVNDEVQVFGVLSSVQGPMNPGETDLRNMARSERTLCRLNVAYPDCITLVESASASIPSWVGHLRGGSLRLVDRFVAAPENDMATAMLLGTRDRLGSERTERFFHTGTIHLLAISGLHLGILAGLFFYAARVATLHRSAVVSLIAFVTIYAILTGLRAPVIRAAILVQIVCLGMLWRRQSLSYNALAAAAIFILVLRPAALFSTGVHLSFMAVGTLFWLHRNFPPQSPRGVERLVLRSRPWYMKATWTVGRWTTRLAFAGAAVWGVTLPIVMYRFHLFSPVSIVLNVLFAMPVMISLVAGFVLILAGYFLRPIAIASGLICQLGLRTIEKLVAYAHDLPGAYRWVVGPSHSWCIVYYVGLFTLAFVPHLRTRPKLACACLLAWYAIPPATNFVTNSFDGARPFECTFLSIGHGTCVVMQFPDDQVVLYDCGRMGVPKTGVRVVSEYLWFKRISHVDAVIVSHADADHYNILPGLLERFSIGQVLMTAQTQQSRSLGVRELMTSIEAAGVAVSRLQSRDQLSFGEVHATVLHPAAEGVDGSDNANSIVLEIQYRDKTVLLPGDLESPGMDWLLAEQPRDCDVVMAPHHGSMGSAPIQFTEWCSPEWIVVSCAQGREWELAFRDRFKANQCEVLHTSEDGAVTITINGRGELSVDSFR